VAALRESWKTRGTIALVVAALLLEPGIILAKRHGWVDPGFPPNVDPVYAVPVAVLAFLGIIAWNLR
jgi:hypothetical protein